MIRELCIKYFVVMLLCMVGLVALSYIMQVAFNFDIGSGGSIVTAIAPAMYCGMKYYEKTGEIAEKSVLWAYARYFTAIQAVAGIMILTILWVTIPDFSILFGELGLLLLAAFGFVLLIYFLANRYFFGFGMRTAEKSKAKS